MYPGIQGLFPIVLETSALTYQHCTRDPEDIVAEAAIKAIGHCVRTQGNVAATGLSALMKLLNSQRGRSSAYHSVPDI